MENDDRSQGTINRHIAILEEKAEQTWKDLQAACPCLRNYRTYKHFTEDFSLEDDCAIRDEFLNDFSRVTSFTKSMNCLLILLFNKELQKLIYCARTPTVREDAWSIIVTEFLGVLPDLQRDCPSIGQFMKLVRSNATTACRKAAAKRNKDADEAFCGWKESVYKKGIASKQAEEAGYNDLLEYLRKNLREDEFEALMQRIRQEYYLRNTSIPGLKEARNTAAERRAIRKARNLLRKYPGG
jgi:hypothetical protein